MPDTQIDPKLEQVVRRIDPQSKLLRAWALKGGISAQVTALEIERFGGEVEKWVVRQHGAVDRAHNPNIAADEFRLLALLQANGIRAPKAYGFDASGEIFPAPYIVLEYVEGAPEFAPPDLNETLLQFARALAQIHRIDGTMAELSFLPQQQQRQTEKLSQRPARLDDSLDEGRIRATLEAVWPVNQINRTALLHGDTWPGNLLWRDGKLAAVIDWENAALGDPLADLSNTRLEVLWAFGNEAMEQFTDCYLSLMPDLDSANLPYWDLCAALRPASKIGDWAGDAEIERKMRAGHKQFVTQAFEKLSAG